MLKILGIALAALLALSSSNVSATVIYNDLKFTVTDIWSWTSPSPPVADVSGEFIYTTGTEWVTPAELLYSNLVIDNHIFNKVTMFHGASFDIFSQGSGTSGEDSLYFMLFGENIYFEFTLAGRDGYWSGVTHIISYSSSAEPIPFPANPVPEPRVYAMVLLGLALIAAVAKRRRIEGETSA
jgi:hypothetical protein